VVNIAESLGPHYFQFILNELKSGLRRGYQARRCPPATVCLV
jgi:hypothetical protein